MATKEQLSWGSSVEDVVKVYELEEAVCECCESIGVHFNVTARSPTVDPRRYDEHEFILLCDICYSTHLGTNFQYPRQHDSDALALMKLVAYIGNEIIKRLPPKQ